MSSYKANNPNNPNINKISPKDTLATVTSNTPVTGVPWLVSGIATRGEVLGVGVGVGVGVGLGLAALLGEGEALELALGVTTLICGTTGDGVTLALELALGVTTLIGGATGLATRGATVATGRGVGFMLGAGTADREYTNTPSPTPTTTHERTTHKNFDFLGFTTSTSAEADII